ncbi:MAG: hypothetical protein AB7U83_12820 [Vicinamibacterales bacterium]
MPTARRCAGCGASLNDPPAGATSITCRFCGLPHDLGGSSPRTAAGEPVVIDLRPARRATAVAAALILGLVGVAVAVGGFVAWRVTRVGGIVSQLATGPQAPPGTAPSARRDQPLAPPALASLTEFGWRTLDVPPPPGGFAAFEPVAALPWAMAIARAWASDAVLTRIDIGRVDATGVVDLGGEATSGYRFSSPGRQLRWRQETDAGSTSPTRTGLTLQIQEATVRALVQEGRNSSDRPAPAPGKILALPEVLTRAKARRGGVPERPFYSGYMIHLAREGWVWYFSAPSGDSFPRARATDGRTYPY